MDLQNLINNISVHKSFDYLLGKFEESYKSNGGSICFWLPAELYSVTKNPEYLEKMREEMAKKSNLLEQHLRLAS